MFNSSLTVPLHVPAFSEVVVHPSQFTVLRTVTPVTSVRDVEGRNDSSSLQPQFLPVSTEEAPLKHTCSPHDIATAPCFERFMTF
jgi:hypothetical protein